jgi:hypothetical protein
MKPQGEITLGNREDSAALDLCFSRVRFCRQPEFDKLVATFGYGVDGRHELIGMFSKTPM